MTRALLIIDVQRGMFGEAEQPHDGRGVVARLAGLIERARASDTPVVFVQHAGGAGDVLAPGTPGFPIVDALAPRADETVIVKQRSSGFDKTDLEARLRAMGVDHLIIGGMQSEMCVDSTVRGADERGFKITLVEDGHSTFDTPVLKAAQVVAQQNATLANFAKLAKAETIDFQPEASARE